MVLSADATQHHINQLHAAGVAACLTKPIAVRELLRTLDGLLDQHADDQHTDQARQPSRRQDTSAPE